MRYAIGLVVVIAIMAMQRPESRAADVRQDRAVGANLMLDNTAVALSSVSGGGMRADVANTARGTDRTSKAAAGRVRYDPTTIQVTGDYKPLLKWASDTWTGQAALRACSIALIDATGKVAGERMFTDALLTELSIPALDAASKEPVALKAAFVCANAELIAAKPGSGKTAAPAAGKGGKLPISSNFKVTMDGLDATRVARVDPIVIKTPAIETTSGASRTISHQPGAVDFGVVRLAIAESGATPWIEWFNESAKQGKNIRKNGSITLLTADLKTELLSIALTDVMIVGVTPRAFGPGAAGEGQVLIDLKPGRIELK